MSESDQNVYKYSSEESFISRGSLARDILLLLVKNYTSTYSMDIDGELQENFLNISFGLADKFMLKAEEENQNEKED